jgi:hypothetical protein
MLVAARPRDVGACGTLGDDGLRSAAYRGECQGCQGISRKVQARALAEPQSVGATIRPCPGRDAFLQAHMEDRDECVLGVDRHDLMPSL